jgi:nicotinate-nucleotide adenylyltransferase
MKIGIFGGTFNPVHYGHLRAAEEVQELFSFDRFFFIPAGRPPFRKPALVDIRHRYEMMRIAVKNSRSFSVSDIEMRTQGPSYSVETIKELLARYRRSELFFIIGIDAFVDLPKWREPLELAELTNFIVISRPGSCFSELSASPILFRVPREDLRKFDSGKRKRLKYKLGTGKYAYLCRITGLDISASSIRKLVKEGKSIKYLLPESVESYIISHTLYKNR